MNRDNLTREAASLCCAQKQAYCIEAAQGVDSCSARLNRAPGNDQHSQPDMTSHPDQYPVAAPPQFAQLLNFSNAISAEHCLKTASMKLDPMSALIGNKKQV